METAKMPHRILLLGGIGEARKIAQYLIGQQIPLIYSIAGLVRIPDLDCEIRMGGFSAEGVSSEQGLVRYISANNISLVINATHPYAATMSANAVLAARRKGIPCWRYLRPEWTINTLADLYLFHSTEELLPRLDDRKRPFFTIGQGILDHKAGRPESQHWIIRSALPAEETLGITLIDSIGPFTYEQDLALMQLHQVDALITKNSGGKAVAGKLHAAMELGIPIYLMARPKEILVADRVFENIEPICDAISERIREDA